MSDIKYEKDYLPGYTGHVPKKNLCFGCTAGEINKLITGQGTKGSEQDIQVTSTKPYSQKNDYLVNPPA